MRTIKQVVEVFQLESHPAMEEARQAHVEKTGNFNTFNFPERLVRSVWYRSDLLTLFDTYPMIKAAIQAFNHVQPKAVDVRNMGPFAAASRKDAVTTVKLKAMKTKYAFRHWKDCD